MTLHPCQVAAPFQVLNARSNIAFFFAPFAGTLKRIDLGLEPANVNANGDGTFDVKLNGVSIFGSPTDRPKILSGAALGNVSGLAVAVAVGDVITFDAAAVPVGGYQGPVMLQALIDDNITGGLDAAAVLALAPGGDLAGTLATVIVEGLRGRSLAGIPAPAATFSDNFNDNVIDASLWTVTAGVTESSQRLNVPGGETAQSAVTFDMRGHYFIFKADQTHDATLRFSLDGPGNYRVEVRLQTQALGRLRLTIHDPTNGDVHNDYFPASSADWTWLRVRLDGSTGHWLLDTAPDASGVPGAWTNQEEAAAPTGAPTASAVTFLVIGATGFWVDEISSNAPTSDPLASKDGWAISWDETHGQFALVQIIGVLMKGIEGVLGAPSGHVTALCEFHYDRVTQRLKIYNDNLGQWDWFSVDGHD